MNHKGTEGAEEEGRRRREKMYWLIY